MIKSATESAMDQVPVHLEPPRSTAHKHLSNSTKSRSGRFPPVEIALKAIARNEQLERALTALMEKILTM